MYWSIQSSLTKSTLKIEKLKNVGSKNYEKPSSFNYKIVDITLLAVEISISKFK